jgi:hypothetical protein
MGYTVIPLIVSVVLGAHHVFVSEAPRLSKLSVFTVVIASLVVWQYFPRQSVVALLLQVAVSLYMLVYLRLTGP